MEINRSEVKEASLMKMHGNTSPLFVLEWIKLRLILISVLLTSCWGSQDQDPSEVVKKTLVVGEEINHPKPFPTLTPIFVESHKNGRLLNRQLMYRGWDFNFDRRIDYIQILSEKEEVEGEAFDLNFDGIIDVEKTTK